jgi:hypothetical protein
MNGLWEMNLIPDVCFGQGVKCRAIAFAAGINGPKKSAARHTAAHVKRK